MAKLMYFIPQERKHRRIMMILHETTLEIDHRLPSLQILLLHKQNRKQLMELMKSDSVEYTNLEQCHMIQITARAPPEANPAHLIRISIYYQCHTDKCIDKRQIPSVFGRPMFFERLSSI